MRKCDICSTPIPHGQNRCPNCGYIYRPDASSQVNKQKKEDYMAQFQPHPIGDETAPKENKPVFSKKKSHRNMLGILAIVIVVLVIGLGVGLFAAISQSDFLDLDIDQAIPVPDFGNEVETFYDFNTLKMEYPEIAGEMQNYYDLAQEEIGYQDADFIEVYEIEDGQLTSAYMNWEIEKKEDMEYEYSLYDFGTGWQYSIDLCYDEEVGEPQFKEADFQVLATFMNVDVSELYSFCMNYYAHEKAGKDFGFENFPDVKYENLYVYIDEIDSGYVSFSYSGML